MSPLPNKPIIAVFDFDKTLTYYDTFPRFLIYLRGKWCMFFALLSLIPSFIQYAFGILERAEIKTALLTRLLKNMPIETLSNKGKAFAKEIIPLYLNPEAISCLKEHQQQGHRCLLVSASLDLYLVPWASSMGFEHLLATHLEIDAFNKVTGKMAGGGTVGDRKSFVAYNIIWVL